MVSDRSPHENNDRELLERALLALSVHALISFVAIALLVVAKWLLFIVEQLPWMTHSRFLHAITFVDELFILIILILAGVLAVILMAYNVYLYFRHNQ